MASRLLSELKWDVAFGIYVMSSLKVDAALLYCRMNGAKNLAVHRHHLEERYLAEDVEEIMKVEDAVGKWKKFEKLSTSGSWNIL
jgi:hypothetical protein